MWLNIKAWLDWSVGQRGLVIRPDLVGLIRMLMNSPELLLTIFTKVTDIGKNMSKQVHDSEVAIQHIVHRRKFKNINSH